MPEQAIKTLVRNHKIKDFTEDNIASLADVFCVSKEVISRRLLDIGKISQTEYDTFILEFKRTFDMEKEIEREKRKEKLVGITASAILLEKPLIRQVVVYSKLYTADMEKD